MGNGVSSNPREGAPANPRLVYSENLSHNNKKPMILDAPVLVDVDHGSVRYRYGPYTDEPVDKRKRIERPYAGTETVDKKHYFYHARLKSQDINGNNEDDFKRLYVTKGPAKSKQKFLYYVYGKGLDAEDGLKLHPTQNKIDRKDFAWPVTRNQNDLYYCLHFLPQDQELKTESSDEDKLMSELESTPDKSSIVLQINENDKISTLKATLAVKLLKAASNLHVFDNNREMRNEDVIGDLRDDNQEKFKVFKVQLLRI
ncbi:uncharacterized protein LOC126818729 [Patella vulgata]|uniref:uncharacterized protein LOC126818729 n=1 Tax=Patella vulgata TaxID=6465 RepID=UPI00217FFBB7|nr:uncharacterized protein LOC126818729 [Patella vulgata]